MADPEETAQRIERGAGRVLRRFVVLFLSLGLVAAWLVQSGWYRLQPGAAGVVLQGIDYISARSCLIEARKSTPTEAGLGWTVNLEREGWIGREALLEEREVGPKWGLVGLEFDWAELEALHAEYDLPPHLAPMACRSAVPVYQSSGSQVGQVTSSTWSPTLKRYLALGQVYAEHAAIGNKVQVEYTVEFERRQVTATVMKRPFFDPERKTFTPNVPPKVDS